MTRHDLHELALAVSDLGVGDRGASGQALRPDLRRGPRRDSSRRTRWRASPARRAVTTGLVARAAARSRTKCYVDIPDIVRETIREIGYTRAKYGFDYETCGVTVSIKEQSRDIAQGVDTSLEAREGAGERGGADAGAGRRRPGHDDRLRLQRDAGADAADDLAGAQALPPARAGAQGRRAGLPAARRQDAGDGGVRVRPAEAHRHRRALHAARPGRHARAAPARS